MDNKLKPLDSSQLEMIKIRQNVEKHRYQMKVEQYLEEKKNSPSFSPIRALVNKFTKFCGEMHRPIKDFTEIEFRLFFSQYCSSNSLQSVQSEKSRLIDFLEYCDEKAAAKRLQAFNLTEKVNCSDYIKTYSDFASNMEKTKTDRLPFLDDIGNNCNELTVKEIVLYLAWIGVPRKIIGELELTDIDTGNCTILHDGDVWNYKEYPTISNVIKQYRKSTFFVLVTKSYMKKNHYKGTKFLRSDRTANIAVDFLVHSAFKSFSFGKNYNRVWKSGIFFRAYQKYREGQKPDASSPQAIEEYFGCKPTQTLLKEWNDYITIRENS